MSRDRVEWNPAEDCWLPATVKATKGNLLSIQLDGNGEILTVEHRHTRTPQDGDQHE